MSNAKTDAAVIEIRGQLDEAHRLLQMAEEAAELAQAASKLARILMGINPSPMPAGGIQRCAGVRHDAGSARARDAWKALSMGRTTEESQMKELNTCSMIER